MAFVCWLALVGGVAAEVSTVANDGPLPVVLLSFNIRHGVGMDGRLDLGRAAAVVRASKADVVVLQEVDVGCGRSGRVDQAAELGRLAGLRAAFGKALDFDGGSYGQAVLSRWDLLETKVHRLPGAGEPRIVFEAVVATPGGKLGVASVHLDHQDPARRLAQAKAAADALGVREHPVVLAGDFNDGPQSPVLASFRAAPWRLWAKRGAGATWPADAPRAEIDFVVSKGCGEQAGGVEVIEEVMASDHRPLRWEFLLPRPTVAP